MMATTAENRSGTRAQKKEDGFVTPPSSPTPEEQYLPDQETLALVQQTKFILQNDGLDERPIEQCQVEFAVATAKMNYDPLGFSFDRWRKSLPTYFRQHSADILLRSMAYANQRDDIEKIYREKLRIEPSAEPEAESESLDELVEKLNTLKKDLRHDYDSPLASTVRRIHAQDPERAVRYLLVEILHRLPTLKEYTWDDAKDAVDGILQTTCEIEDTADLLTLTKMCKGKYVIDWFKQLQSTADQKSNRSTERYSYQSYDEYE